LSYYSTSTTRRCKKNSIIWRSAIPSDRDNGIEFSRMIYSGRTEYAIRGLSELASRAGEAFVMLDDVVTGTDLPRDFLAKIFQDLVRAGILKSARGRGGGFALAHPPHEVTLMNVVEAMEGPNRLDRCVIGLDKCSDAMPCAQHDLYKPIRQRLRDYLMTTTLADLAASLRTKQAWQRIQQNRAAAKVSGTRVGEEHESIRIDTNLHE
jgi:Rrf2 family iron-sulfur cluster assembly transcriptional regulator